jgi:hypothetical protein
MTDGRNDARERLEGRFDDNDGAQNDRNSKTERKSKKEKKSKNSKKAKNVKKAWNARSVYLPDDLNERVDREFKRLDFELSDSDAIDGFGKTRDFYPLLFELALEEFEDMSVEELEERLSE